MVRQSILVRLCVGSNPTIPFLFKIYNIMENILQNLLLLTMAVGSFFVLTSRNHVHSVMFLILVFVSAAGILLYLGAEFIALIFIIIYVGAIAVLFLFIVMMLDIKMNRTKNNIMQYVPFGVLFASLFIIEFYISVDNLILNIPFKNNNANWYLLIDNITNIELLGQVLYQEYIICFLLCGILLLIAMLGAIILTINFRSHKTNEITAKQLSRGNYPFFLFSKKN